MARLARKVAGQRVSALAGQLADDLLQHEQAVFARVAKRITNGLPAARRVVADALPPTGDVSALASSRAVQDRLVDLHTGTLGPCFDAAEPLLVQVVELTVDSIRAELRLCERTLSSAYEGLADEAVDGVVDNADVIQRRALMSHSGNLNATVAGFKRELRKQLLLAKQYSDTPEQLDKRLFSPTPASRPGFGGRGVWHRSGSWVDASTRDASISTMNAVRMAAMRRFNEIGATRG